jgi:hypothetical protein
MLQLEGKKKPPSNLMEAGVEDEAIGKYACSVKH